MLLLSIMLSQDLNKILQIINEYISELLPQNELKNFLLNGSKLMRSKLAILYFRAQNYEINDDFLKILAAGELIHNASLLHDDVIDNSELRRGRTTIVKKYSSDISVLCGDYVVSKAIELLLKINNYEILSIFNNCVQNMTQAEVKQYLGRNTMSDREKYIEISKGKTAELFAAILSSCAIISNLEKKLPAKFGYTFGICFQIKNDFETRSIDEDKNNKTPNVIDVLGIENANALLDNYKEEMRDMLKNFPNNKYTAELKGLVEKL